MQTSDNYPLSRVYRKRARKWIEEAKNPKTRFLLREELSHPKFCCRNGTVCGSLSSTKSTYLEVNLEQERVWNVRGGSEPRLVSAYDQHYKCNCPDYAKGNHCKHIMAVQLEQKDPELTQTLEVIMASKHHSQLELYGLWYQ